MSQKVPGIKRYKLINRSRGVRYTIGNLVNNITVTLYGDR